MQLTEKQINYCMECGICTGSCPAARALPSFSPRKMIKRAMSESGEDVLKSQDLWACLSCARCSVRCPAEIDFPEFTRFHAGAGPQDRERTPGKSSRDATGHCQPANPGHETTAHCMGRGSREFQGEGGGFLFCGMPSLF